MKLLKTRLRNLRSDKSLSHLMKIAIESPDELQDTDLEEIVNIWNRKNRSLFDYFALLQLFIGHFLVCINCYFFVIFVIYNDYKLLNV